MAQLDRGGRTMATEWNQVGEDSTAGTNEILATARTSEPSTTAGWEQAAIAMNSVLQLSIPMLMKMEFDAHDPLFIDFRYRAFAWSTPLSAFPEDAVLAGLQTEPTDLDAGLLFDLPGQPLDGLLWLIGLNSFHGGRAPWLAPNERYKLSRWPNLTQHRHTMRQMQMLAVLGNAYVSAGELADMAGVDNSEAQSLINALSLLRILNRSVQAPVAVVVAPQATKRGSLFSRLRARLGL